MIKVWFLRNNNNEVYGFELSGHAGYKKQGEDIVCSAVTILVFNTINSIEAFTQAQMDCSLNDDGGYIKCILPELKNGEKNSDATLLFNSLVLGLNSLIPDYGKYISIFDEEVQ